MVRKTSRKNMRSRNSRRLFALRKRSKRSLRGGSRRKSIRSTRRRVRRMRGGEKYNSHQICEQARQNRKAAMGSLAMSECVQSLNVMKPHYTKEAAIRAAASAFYGS